jgi:hypothetical protein
MPNHDIRLPPNDLRDRRLQLMSGNIPHRSVFVRHLRVVQREYIEGLEVLIHGMMPAGLTAIDVSAGKRARNACHAGLRFGTPWSAGS